MRVFISLMFVAMMFLAGCGQQSDEAAANDGASSEVQVVKVKVDGMTCGGCTNSIEQALTKKDGVIECEVSLESHAANVTIDPSKTDGDAIVKTIEKAGYQASLVN